MILSQWREMLDGVRDDPEIVRTALIGLAKQRIVNGIRERYDLDAHDAKLRAIDLQYHDLRPEKSLAQRVGLSPCYELMKFVKQFTMRRAPRGPIFAVSASPATRTKSLPRTGFGGFRPR